MNVAIKHLIVILLIFFPSLSIYCATNYRLNTLSSNEGLSQQDVDCMLQDKFGFVWIGTYDGLNRYDGNKFQVYRYLFKSTNSISDNRISSLEEWESRDELWIGTDGGGLNCYNQKTETFTSYMRNNEDGCGVISCLHYFDNSLWVGSLKGLSQITFDKKGKMVTSSFDLNVTENNKEAQRIISIAHDNIGNIIVGTSVGIYIKSPNENVFSLEKDGISVRRVVKDKVGNMWILTSTDIFFYSVSQQQMKGYINNPVIACFNGKNGETAKAIIPITDHLLLLNTNAYLYWIHINNGIISFEELTFSNDSFTPNNDLKSLMVDNTLNVWISSSMDGVARFDLNEKRIYPYDLTLLHASDKFFIQTLIKDKNGNIWIGSGKGCYITNPKNKQIQKLKGCDESVYALIQDQEGNIWCNTLSNIYFFPKANPKAKISLFSLSQMPITVRQEDGPYGLCEDVKNRIIWVGMRSGLLQIKHNNGSFKFKHYDKKLFKMPHLSNLMKLFFDADRNEILVGTSNQGLFCVKLTNDGDIESVKRINNLVKSETEDHIWTIFKASNNLIYLGTDSGVKQLIRGKDGVIYVELLENSDYRLQTYKITSIIEDNNHLLWLSTGSGLFSYDPKNGEVHEYLNTDGLSSRILTEGSLYDPEINSLYIGSVKGLNIVELSSIKKNEFAPKTVIKEIRINNMPVIPNAPFNKRIILNNSLLYTSKIKLKYNENNFTIDFASLHFSNPGKNQFSYKLDGFDKNWTYSNNTHTATFTNLSSGTYTFMVKSANCDGVWEKEPLKLIIRIDSAPWNTIWAYLLYLIILSVIVILGYKYLSDKRRLKHELFVEQLEHQKKIEIAEVKLKYHTNITHELRTPLSLIIAPVEELITRPGNDAFLNTRLQMIKSNADRLIELIGQFLDFRKVLNDKYVLRIKRQNLHDWLLSIKNSFSASVEQKNISFDLYYDLNFDYCWCDIEVLNKVCYNLLSNAIKYTPAGGRIAFYVSANDDASILAISIEDNGIGIEESELDKIFERFYQVPGTIGGTGIGLDLCRHLIKLHKGKISVKSHKGEGTIFTLDIPITRDAYELNDLQEIEEDTPIYNSKEINDANVSINGTPLILLVEDNFELRHYVVTLLSDENRVIEAENGEIGYNMALNQVPDLILSDIMMPIMDGIELTKKCKDNMITSHIPIILLTAKDSLDNEIEGLTYGADDYIRKPFNPQTLKLKINNIIKLTRKFKKEEDNGDVLSLNEREQSFLSEFEKIVLDNISSPDFGIDDICKSMCMSRMQLYRKITAILAQKPSQYIKEIKMKKALELMKRKGYNITETMYEVGYTNYTHFSKLFAEVNGESPRKILGMKDKDS